MIAKWIILPLTGIVFFLIFDTHIQRAIEETNFITQQREVMAEQRRTYDRAKVLEALARDVVYHQIKINVCSWIDKQEAAAKSRELWRALQKEIFVRFTGLEASEAIQLAIGYYNVHPVNGC